jgi:hypothetical protein
MGNRKAVWKTCGECGRSWNDAEPSARTPSPAGRCPFEDIHGDERMMYDGRPVKAVAIEVTVSVLSYVFADYAEGQIQHTERYSRDVRKAAGDAIVDAIDHRAHHLTDAEDGDLMIVPAATSQIVALKMHDVWPGHHDLSGEADVTELAEGYAAETF